MDENVPNLSLFHMSAECYHFALAAVDEMYEFMIGIYLTETSKMAEPKKKKKKKTIKTPIYSVIYFMIHIPYCETYKKYIEIHHIERKMCLTTINNEILFLLTFRIHWTY